MLIERWLIPHWAMKVFLYTITISVLTGLLATAFGVIMLVVFLLKRNQREEGGLRILITNIVSVLFVILLLRTPMAKRGKMNPESKGLAISTKAILYDPSSSGKGVVIYTAIAQEEKVDGRTGNHMIKNLAVGLKLANRITIQSSPESDNVVVMAYSVNSDNIEYNGRNEFYSSIDSRFHNTWQYRAPKSDSIRINGDLMSLSEATERYPVIPVRE